MSHLHPTEMETTYVQRVTEENRRYLRDLLAENEHLRLLVSVLRPQRLSEDGSVADALRAELAQLREELARHRVEQAD